MENDDPVRFAAIGDVQVRSAEIPAQQFEDPFQSPARTQLQWTGFQNLKKVVLAITVLECAVDEYDHLGLCIAYSSKSVAPLITRKMPMERKASRLLPSRKEAQ